MNKEYIDSTRDVGRAINDIKILLAYIEGKDFQIKDDTVESGWIDINDEYPLTRRDAEYRVRAALLGENNDR